jgi:hypothetical protein
LSLREEEARMATGETAFLRSALIRALTSLIVFILVLSLSLLIRPAIHP